MNLNGTTINRLLFRAEKVYRKEEPSLKTGIHKHPTFDTWFLVTQRSTYVIGATADGYLVNLHWGNRLERLDDLNATMQDVFFSQNPPPTYATEELPVFGGLRFRDNVLKAELPDGTRELNLLFAGNANITEGYILDVDLRDGYRTELLVTLHYELDIENDIIRRSYTIRNGLDKRINLSKAFSAAWHLPTALGSDEKREILTLAGEWAAEAMVESTELRPGVTHVVQSQRGFPSHVSYPYFAIRQVPSDVNPSTEVYFGAIGWSGSWEITAHTSLFGTTRVVGGMHHQDFGWTLEPNESFTTPIFVAGFTSEGMPGARKLLPRHVRKYQQKNLETQKDSNVFHPVLYNSWEAVTFNVTAEKQLELAEIAAPLGIELFVIDDGWFGDRNNDSAGLGDWYVNEEKFPNGLKPVADRVHELGMKFGLWFESEGVNPNSDLYREHPDWVFYYEGIPRYEARSQLVLNLALPEVREYVYDRMATLIAENDIDYIKWDMNRPWGEVTMHDYDRNPREAWVLSIREGFYYIVDKLKAEFPKLWIESCASGGGRMDIGVVEKTDQVWTSDNTRPDARIMIQYGASLFLPPRVMYGWVTNSPWDEGIHIPLSFRFHVSFQGGLGIGSNIHEYTEDELEESAGWIELYKKIRPVIQNGDLDWLVQPSRMSELVAVSQTTSHDQSEAVVLGYRFNSPFSTPLNWIRLRNLDKSARYSVKVWTSSPHDVDEEYEMSGALLMHKGILLTSLNNAQFKSAVVWLKRN
ncbi:alpha-galactosidase [Zychaea mexicana]|uniref:alpha-galactosidase n=1 Tax=Zychaea mexicana TaxID=64656 RepID=UPI0022FE19A8|nr:alpha-galactosidase [Zychaea mexicana]KAI9492080.1 alpha-galactosidase [Zychaea mexicana]